MRNVTTGPCDLYSLRGTPITRTGTNGGAIDVGGVVVDGGQLYVLSGYGMFGQMPGDMLLVYE
jgi:hypothetical protein